MFGFFIGTACLVGLVAVARGGRYFGYRGFGRRRLLHWALARLDATPGQEKVIRGAVYQFGEEAWALRREARDTRSDIAAAFRAPELDKALLDSVFEKHDDLIEKLRTAAVRAAEQVHGTLDERQRKDLADMIEAGPWRRVRC